MAYQGYLIKVGNYTIPLGLIQADSYSVMKSGQDLDSYRDANGDLHRTALSNFLYKVEFQTKPMLNATQFEAFWKNIKDNYISAKEKSVNITIYVPEERGYVTRKAYIPDVNPTIYYADANKVLYDAVRFAFITYGKD